MGEADLRVGGRVAIVSALLFAGACGTDGTGPGTTVPTTSPPPTIEQQLALVPIEIDVDQPLDIAVRANSLLLAERPGRVVELIPDGSGGYDVAGVVVDLSDEVGSTESELGLLGVAVDPDGSRMWVNHTRADDGATVIAEYQIEGDTGSLEGKGRRELVTIDQPFVNHNGGDIEYGPDGALWVGTGDGGAADDPDGRSQRLNSPLGKILRLDPDARGAVPSDNPYLDDSDADPLVWARGVRNPWRISFDHATGDLWIADVGQGTWEEVNVLLASDQTGRGADLGWDRKEGFGEFAGAGPTDDWAEGGEVIDPVHVYPHDGRCSITGGFVYRGAQIAVLDGTYLFADLCDGKLRTVTSAGLETDLGLQTDTILSINQDEMGEPLLLTANGIFRVRLSG